jgi:hypothetical protein
VIAVSSLVESSLTAIADVAVIAGGPDQGFRGEAMVSPDCHGYRDRAVGRAVLPGQ